MADKDIRDRDVAGLEDVCEVGSRVSWAAILAGAVMALAVCLLLTLLGTAIGFTASDSVDEESLGWGAAIWAILTTIVGLFIGGWITSQCVVGETKTESVVHGIIMWGVFLAALLWLAASGIGFGVGTGLQAATAASNTSEGTWQQMARAAGVPQERIDQMMNESASAANDPQQQAMAAEEFQETGTQASWWTLAGMILSIAAAVGGALVGAGPTFRLLPLHVTHRHFEQRSLMGGA